MLPIAETIIGKFNEKEFNFDMKEAGVGDVLIRFPYNGMVASLIFSGEKGEYLTLYFHIDSVPEGKVFDALGACNSLNASYKWLKFFLDKENDIMAQDDAILTEETAFDETMELMIRAFNIVKEAKPTLMRVIYA